MKKKYLGLLFIALMMVTVLLVVSCKKEPAEDPKCVVTFDTQGGTTKIDPVSVDPGAVVAKPKKTPKRSG